MSACAIVDNAKQRLTFGRYISIKRYWNWFYMPPFESLGLFLSIDYQITSNKELLPFCTNVKKDMSKKSKFSILAVFKVAPQTFLCVLIWFVYCIRKLLISSFECNKKQTEIPADLGALPSNVTAVWPKIAIFSQVYPDFVTAKPEPTTHNVLKRFCATKKFNKIVSKRCESLAPVSLWRFQGKLG